MSVDHQAGRLLEITKGLQGTREEVSQALVKEFAQALFDPSLDLPDFPEQARFFLQLFRDRSFTPYSYPLLKPLPWG
jgi:hypothetical protein